VSNRESGKAAAADTMSVTVTNRRNVGVGGTTYRGGTHREGAEAFDATEEQIRVLVQSGADVQPADGRRRLPDVTTETPASAPVE